uniref:Cysteine sulfinic acid decarboxylase n=1 Tax=Canis lupus familiaris TaxID=9615 RepID=A0A8C0PIW7_CANLF
MADSKPLCSRDGDPMAAEALLRDVFGIIVDEVIRKGTSASEKVCEWKEPEELKQLLDLELRNQGEASEQILARCRAVIRYSVKTCGCRAAGGSGLGAARAQLRLLPQATRASSTSSSRGGTRTRWRGASSPRASTPASECPGPGPHPASAGSAAGTSVFLLIPSGPFLPAFAGLLTPVFPPCPSLAPGRQLVLPGCPPSCPPQPGLGSPPSARPASCPSPGRYTYEIAPVFVLMEEEVLKKLRALVGWSSGDGVFCPGGSISNMYAVNLARYQRYPDCKQRGLRALPPLALFTSKEVGGGSGLPRAPDSTVRPLSLPAPTCCQGQPASGRKCFLPTRGLSQCSVPLAFCVGSKGTSAAPFLLPV